MLIRVPLAAPVTSKKTVKEKGLGSNPAVLSAQHYLPRAVTIASATFFGASL